MIRACVKPKISDEKNLDPKLRVADSDVLASKSFHLNCWNLEITLMFLTFCIERSGLLYFIEPELNMKIAIYIIGYSS